VAANLFIKPELHFTPGVERCEAILEEALFLLSDHGMRSRSRPVQELLLETYPGTAVIEDRVIFDDESMRAFLDSLRAWAAARKRDGDTAETLRLGQPWSCLQLADLECGMPRNATESDLIRIVRFLDSFGVAGSVAPVVLADLPADLRELRAVITCVQQSEEYGAPAHIPDIREVPYYREIATIAGRALPVLIVTVNSPMQFDDAALEFALTHRRTTEFELRLTGGLPSAGSTSAIVFPASYIQATAESLAASMMAYALTGVHHEPYLRNDPFDMRYATYAVAGPVYGLLDLFGRALVRHLTGADRSWGNLLSMSPWPDQQAQFERTMSCWSQALAGARYFNGAGQLCSDEVFSAEQVVLDREILTACARFLRGIEWSGTVEENRQILREGVHQGTFLDHDSTLSKFREFVFDSELFPARSLGQWRADQRDVLQRAKTEVDEYVGRNTFSRDDQEVRALEAVFHRAKKNLEKPGATA
jgi:trimethylamine:corrinoid methyltransferase-like protein